ncbi:PREDICTED: pre-mRNA-splicing factor SLU7-like [Ipomoea nil]|uniref:pre-mRNA-splicing factor SLU7-like n=1 Tax=Ipomoea nil TaxID=35883 RepID=UPI00090133DA|nr:PREDICTED: pre-mRNA-splicing factor SLU7-like [Ipomoea nil]
MAMLPTMWWQWSSIPFRIVNRKWRELIGEERGNLEDESKQQIEITRTTVRNLRIREDTAKYLLNLDPNSAHYDPKTRSMREDPLLDMDPKDKFYAGDNHNRLSGEALELLNHLHIHMQSEAALAPSQAELLYKSYRISKEKLESQRRDTILEKYGNAANEETLSPELLLGQSDIQVEYDRFGRIVKEDEMLLPTSKYEEDVYINNHTSVWGSWWKENAWGYKCCKQTIRNTYCTLGR